MQSDVPLPYDCNTLADVYTDVDEMYDPLAVAAVPVDWAQFVPHSNESKDIHMISPVVSIPSSGTHTCRLRTNDSADSLCL